MTERPGLARRAVGVALAVFILLVPALAGAAEGYAGKSLAAALARLREAGLPLVYSTRLVRPGMTVAAEPRAVAPRAILDEILAPYGLTATAGPDGTIIVTRADLPASPAELARARFTERVRVSGTGEPGPAPVTTLEGAALRSPSAIGDDPLRAAAAVAGLVTADTSAVVGGAAGPQDGALVLLDGLALDAPYHLRDFLAFASILDGRAVGRVEAHTGVLPAQFADQATGVLDLSTLAPPIGARTLVGAGNLNLGLITSNGRADGGGWLLSARTWRPDSMVDSVTLDGEGVDPAFADLFGKTEWRLPGGSLLALHLLAAHDDLNYASDTGDASVGATDQERHAWLTWKTPWTTRLYTETLLSDSRLARARRGSTFAPDGAGAVDQSTATAILGLRQDWVYVASETATLLWGFDARRQRSDQSYRSVSESDPGRDLDLAVTPGGTDLGLYLAARARFGARLSAEAGLRRDRQSLAGERQVSPRIQIASAIGDRGLVRAGWGRLHPAQTIDDLPLADGVVEFAPAARVTATDLAYEQRLGAGLSMVVSLFRRDTEAPAPHFENLYDPYRLFPELADDRVQVAPEASAGRGATVALQGGAGRSILWHGAYTLASARDRIDGGWVAESRDQRHAADLGMLWHPTAAWEIGVAGVYHSGWPATGMTATSTPGADGAPIVTPIPGPRNALRYPAYHRLDASLARRFFLDGGVLGLRLQVTNLYGRENVCCATGFDYRPQADGTVVVDRQEGHFQRPLPVASITFEF